MAISIEHFSFNEILHFKFSGSADSSKTASSQTSSVSPVSVSISTSSNDSQSPSTSAVISIDDTEEQDKLVEETTALKFSSLKQDELNKQINVGNEILVVLYKKKELNQIKENDRKEIETRKENFKKLKKKLRELKLNRQCSQKYRNERKRKLDALDEETGKKVTGKGTSEPGRPQKYDNAELVDAICRIAIPGSAAH